MKSSRLFNASIPGEEFTSDSRKYAWHKPPQYSNFDDAFEYFIDEVLGNNKRLLSAVLMAKNGFSAVALIQNLMVQSVGKGKISPDMSLLIAGPLYKTLVRLFDVHGEDYLTGFDSPEEIKEFSKTMGEPFTESKKIRLSEKQEQEMQRITEEAMSEIPEGGLMGAPKTNDVEIPMDKTEGGLIAKPAKETV